MVRPKKAKRQRLSTLRIDDLPNELVIGTFSYLNMQDLVNCSQVSKRFRAVVVDEQGRRKENLLKIIQDLQCFKCKKVPLPNGDQRKRYLCKNSFHSLCEYHSKITFEDLDNNIFEMKCPCGSLVDQDPSQSIARKLQNLPWICQNYKRGCHEVKMDVNNLKIHHGKCIFRKVFCPHPGCSKYNLKGQNCHIPHCRSSSCWGTRVCFKDIFDHFNTNHKKIWHQIDGESNKWTDLIKGDFLNGCSWYSGKMTSTNGDVFALFARASRIHPHNKVLYIWMMFFGSTEEARNYSCRISIKNNCANEFNYSGPVHTLDKNERTIVNSGFLLLIGSNAAKHLTEKENNLKIEVTIQNLKSEAISKESQDFYQTDSDLSLDSDSSLDLDSDSE
jgi:hypothetical protein